jgi:hypothetical protein
MCVNQLPEHVLKDSITYMKCCSGTLGLGRIILVRTQQCYFFSWPHSLLLSPHRLDAVFVPFLQLHLSL